MVTPQEHKEILAEFEALIAQADGKENFPGEKVGFSVKKDPALSRTLEFLRDSYLDTYNELHNKN